MAAGARKDDIATSGFSRVDILGNEDLFPNEGFEFKPGKSKLTNSYRMSEDSPFTNTVKQSMAPKSEEQKVMEEQMPNMIRSERLCTKTAANAIATGQIGELRPLHSQIAQDCVQKQLKQQLIMKEQTRAARMKDDAHWAQVEQEEAEATHAFLNRNDNSKRDQQKQLAEVYKRELRLHKQKALEQQEIEKAEAARIAKIQAEEAAAEKEKARKKKEEEKKALAEFEKTNGSLLNRKKRQQQEEAAIEAAVQKEKEQIEAQKAEREAHLQKIREEKEKRREKIFQIQSKKFLELKAKNERIINTAASELAEREEAERLAEIERKQQMRKQRNEDWQNSLKLKAQREEEKKNRPKTPIEDDKYDEERAFEEVTRREEMKRLREAQLRQIAERKAREAKEREEELKPQSCYFLKDNDDW